MVTIENIYDNKEKIKRKQNIEYKEEINLKRIANDWLEELKLHLSKFSYAVYKSEINRYIVPEIGTLKLVELENYDYTQFVTNLCMTLEPKTARDITSKLKAILCYTEDKYGVRIGIRKIKLPQLEIERK